MGRFVATVLVAGEFLRQRRIRAEEERRQGELEEQRRNAARRINAADWALLADARSRLREWRLGHDLRAFADEVARLADEAQADGKETGIPDRWVEWARDMGAHLERKAAANFKTMRSYDKGDGFDAPYAYSGESSVEGNLRLAFSSVDEVLARDAEEKKRRGY